MKILLSALLLLLLNFNSQAQKEIEFKTVSGKFAESASKYDRENVVEFFKKDQADGRYSAVVSIDRGKAAIDRFPLPDPEFTWSIMEPMSVFFANVDDDPDNELLIIDRNMTGVGPTGNEYFYRTRVYDWTGSDFRHLEDVSEKIGTADTPAAVKEILKIPTATKSQKPDIAAFNAKIKDAARKKEFWVGMPTLVAAMFVGKFGETKERTITITAPSSESADRLDVVITDDGMADDSVRSVRFKLILRSDAAGVWYLDSADKAQRCWQGRGHEDYSGAPCV